MYFSLYTSYTFLSRRCPWNKQWRLDETQARRESGRHLSFSRVSNKISVDSTFLKRMRDISPLCSSQSDHIPSTRSGLDRVQTREICEKQEKYFKGKVVTFTIQSLILYKYPVDLLTFFWTLLKKF